MNNKIKHKLNNFVKDGFIEFPSLLNKKDCRILYKSLTNCRDWGSKLFLSEKNYKKELDYFRAGGILQYVLNSIIDKAS